jgi:hypothetical protein
MLQHGDFLYSRMANLRPVHGAALSSGTSLQCQVDIVAEGRDGRLPR